MLLLPTAWSVDVFVVILTAVAVAIAVVTIVAIAITAIIIAASHISEVELFTHVKWFDIRVALIVIDFFCFVGQCIIHYRSKSKTIQQLKCCFWKYFDNCTSFELKKHGTRAYKHTYQIYTNFKIHTHITDDEYEFIKIRIQLTNAGINMFDENSNFESVIILHTD